MERGTRSGTGWVEGAGRVGGIRWDGGVWGGPFDGGDPGGDGQAEGVDHAAGVAVGDPAEQVELGGAEGGDGRDHPEQVAGVVGQVGGAADHPAVDAATAAEGDLDPAAQMDLAGEGLGHPVGEGAVQVEQRNVDQHLDACGPHVQVQPGFLPRLRCYSERAALASSSARVVDSQVNSGSERPK